MVAIMLCGPGLEEEGSCRVSDLPPDSLHTSHKSSPAMTPPAEPEKCPQVAGASSLSMPEVSTINRGQTPGPPDTETGGQPAPLSQYTDTGVGL